MYHDDGLLIIYLVPYSSNIARISTDSLKVLTRIYCVKSHLVQERCRAPQATEPTIYGIDIDTWIS